MATLSVTLIVLLGGCAPDGSSSETSDPEGSGPTVDSSIAEVAPDGQVGITVTDTATWAVDSLVRRADPPDLPSVRITELRTGVHPGFERLTVELEGSVGHPEVRAGYVAPPVRACGSGRDVEPVGESWLEVDLHPAAAHAEAGESTLPGREIGVEGERLLRIYRTCDFEGHVTFVLALSGRSAFRVLTLEEPPRIAVDVQRGAPQ